MATELGKAYVQIIPSAKGITGSITRVLSGESVSAGTKSGEEASKAFGSRFSSLGGKFIKTGAIATAMAVPLVAGIKKAMAAYEVQATAETKLTEIYKTRMGVGKKAVKSTLDMASALQKQGVIGDEVAISGSQQLATFAKYPSTINTLMPAMNNLLAQQKGVNATTDDAVNIGNLMGKVLNGQTGALKRVGISFSEGQEKVLKYGTEQEKAAMLAKVITQNVGNMNSALAKTPAGKIQQLKNSFGDLWEGIGAALAPALSKVASYLSNNVVPVLERIVNFMVAHPIIGKIVVGITALLAVGGPLLIFIGTLMSSVGIIVGSLTTVGPLLAGLLGPIALVVAAIAGAIAVGVLLYKNWDKIKAWLLKTWTTISTQARAKFTAVKNAIIKPFQTAKTKITTLANNIKTGVVSKMNALKSSVQTIFNSIKSKMTSPIDKAKAKIASIMQGIKNKFPFKIGEIISLKLPTIKLETSSKKVFGKTITYPTGFNITWAAKGLIANSPQLIGIGDVRGGEAAVPLTPFWNRLDTWGDSLVNGMNTIASNNNNGEPIEITLYAFPNGPQMQKWVVNTYDTGKKRLG